MQSLIPILISQTTYAFNGVFVSLTDETKTWAGILQLNIVSRKCRSENANGTAEYYQWIPEHIPLGESCELISISREKAATHRSNPPFKGLEEWDLEERPRDTEFY
jgi:hypothetical protein